MKMKFKKALFAKRPSYLRITLNKGEKLNYMAAQWLVQYAENVFLPCVYKERDRSTLLFYDLREALPLKTFVKAGLSLGQYERLLCDLYESISIITSLQREPTCLVTDPAFVFVREGTHLQFVFVPVAHKLKDNVFTPLDLLLWLSDKEHLQMVLASDERKQDALYAWTQTQSVFSLAYFKAFLDKEFPRKEQDKHPRYSYTDVYDEKCAQRALIYRSRLSCDRSQDDLSLCDRKTQRGSACFTGVRARRTRFSRRRHAEHFRTVFKRDEYGICHLRQSDRRGSGARCMFSPASQRQHILPSHIRHLYFRSLAQGGYHPCREHRHLPRACRPEVYW